MIEATRSKRHTLAWFTRREAGWPGREHGALQNEVANRMTTTACSRPVPPTADACYVEDMTSADERDSDRDARRNKLLHGAMQRFDFIREIGEVDAHGNAKTMVLRPDPRRYDRIEDDGRTIFVDRYTRIGVAFETIVEGFKNSSDLKSFFLSPRIENTIEYAADRLDALRHEIKTGEHVPPAQQPVSHRPLDLPEERPVTFISLDVCGATRMRADDPKGFDRAFGLAFQELASAVGQFHGSIYKPTGDGFIAYIDHPSVTARDSAVDLGLTLLALLDKSLNPALVEMGVEPLSVRVGADHGPARMRSLRSAATGFSHDEVVSDALNRTVKLQEAAEPGTLLIGEALRQQLHVGWLERCTEVDTGIAHAVGIPGYKCFRIN